MMRVPAILCIDLEPDLREIPVPSPPRWLGFERMLEVLPAVRDGLAAASGRDAAFGWFLRMDPQVRIGHGSATWVTDRYGAEIAELGRTHADETGVHAHSWRRVGGRWCADNADPEWVNHCVQNSLTAYEAAFGHRCPIYRGGDRYFDADVFALLRAHGVEVDLTLEPGAVRSTGLRASETTTGSIPAVPRDLQRPYLPDPDDPLATTDVDSGLLAIPLTAAVSFRDGAAGSALPPVMTLTLWTPPRQFAAALDGRLADPALTHLAFAIRTDLALDRILWAWTERNLAYVAQRLGAGIEWCRPTRAAALLRPLARSEPPPETTFPPATADAVIAAGAALEAAVLDAEVTLAVTADERAELVAALDAARLECAQTRTTADAAAVRAAAAESDLATIRATRWWRAHQRAEPLLRRLLRRPRS